jgi:excisionase family DNA binding protein
VTTPVTAYYTIAEVAQMLRIAHDAALDLVASGELPATHVGRRRDAKRPTYRISAVDLDAFLASRRTQPAAKKLTRRSRSLPTVREYV